MPTYYRCISKDAEREFGTTLGATQDGPTFSRSELGALLNTMSMTLPYKNVNRTNERARPRYIGFV